MDTATARAWLVREIESAHQALGVSPGTPQAQGRVGRLQRHLSRLAAHGDEYLPTVLAEAGASAVEPVADVVVEPRTPTKARQR